MFSSSALSKVFVGVVVKVDKESTVDAYLYAGVKKTQTFSTYMPETHIVALEAESSDLAQQQADRISSSGYMGARVCDADELMAMIKEFE